VVRTAAAARQFDLGAFLEEVRKEVQPEIERKKRAALLANESEEAVAEMSVRFALHALGESVTRTVATGS
jgi:hypothetical protein